MIESHLTYGTFHLSIKFLPQTAAAVAAHSIALLEHFFFSSDVLRSIHLYLYCVVLFGSCRLAADILFRVGEAVCQIE